ncbi:MULTISPECIES: XVIPCD domain-containing protein [Xanthomonas]|uniref:XVIPCD domain-containing protein n=1 Tax=Xanthomonas TaxID=338 RepID=UPI001ADAD3B9|nr:MULTISPECIES: XVIPCD domain-containing protein [unclassified Xanthomonas]MBO9872826.1 hypothetical protein [Xanthomonas sp. D-93]WNH44953.1 hypothetical protein PG878_00270 [Xanthomonas sp. A6251]
MPTPQEKLDAMLDAYQAAHKTSTTDPGKQLRTLIDTTPGLKATFLDQIAKDRLDGFEPLSTAGALGTYNAYGKTMAVSIDQLNSAAAGNVQTANSLRFTLGHEIDHAVTRDARLTEDRTLQASVAQIARGAAPHDYTPVLKAYNESARSREVGAEIAGFNTLAGYVRSRNPNAGLKEMYDASPNDMQMYVDVDLSKTPATYTPKAGLTLGSDLKMAPTPANVDAMGTYFYKAAGYPEQKIGNALRFIETAEQQALSAARIANPTHAAPKINVNLKELGVEGLALPRGFDDTSPRLQPPTQAPPSTSDLRGGYLSPADPGHADHALLQKVRAGVGEIDRQIGKPWDDHSDRLSASALTLAVDKNFNFKAEDDIWVGLNQQSRQHAAGEMLLVRRTGGNLSPDPDGNRAEMPTADALAQPAGQRYQQVEAIRQSQAEEPLRQQAAMAMENGDPSKGVAPKAGM